MGLFYIYDNNVWGTKTFVLDFNKKMVIPDTNEYEKDVDISYVRQTTDFEPDSYQEILNIYYTALNSGWTEFTFYCPARYETCLDDIKTISKDQSNLLSHINNFVNTYNSYSNIYTTYYKTGKIKLEIVRLYDSYTIQKIETKVDEIINNLIVNTDTNTTKIQKIHDYIINNTKYDSKKIDNIHDATYKSNTAYGLLYENYAVCSGYTDTMAIFLDKFNITNVKVATAKHVWNLVYLDNKWYHLDLTWDDPVSSDGKEILSQTFFLISGEKIRSLETEEHNFDTNIYPEAQ